MNEKQLLSVSFIFSLIGILIILLISYVFQPELYKISELSKENVDEIVRVKGNIESFYETPGLYLINLVDDSARITVVVFKENEMNLVEGELIEVKGSVVEYGDEIEIIAKEVVL
ncbi:hypothetical protein J4425_00875 [Candidatus Woesearchaeota archaeon]|nr:hypothetical protein [Candidatus Woesearchaeota archaeon]